MTSRKSRHGRPRSLSLGLAITSVFLIGWFALLTTAHGAAVIVNEYSAVASNKYLDGGDYSDADGIGGDDLKEDSYFRTIAGLPDGRIEGNGGNWLELLVIEDHLDMRGFALHLAETDGNDTNGTDLWYGDGAVEQGIVTFSSTATIWSDVRAGTLITISEKDSIGVDTDLSGSDRNFTDGVAPGAVDVTVDLASDISYDPVGGDWWIHVSSRGELGEADPLVSTVTNVTGDGPGDFAVGDLDWQATIVDSVGDPIYGPIAEAFANWGGSKVNDKESGRLELPPQLADQPSAWPDPPWTVADWNLASNAGYDDSTSTSFGQLNAWGTPELAQDVSVLRSMIPEPGSMGLLLAAAATLLLIRRRTRVA